MAADHLMYFFMIIATLSMLLTLFVCLNIVRYGARTVSSRLILFINASILVDSIASLPDVYIDHISLCTFMAFLKSYSELINISIAFLMVVLAYNISFPRSRNSRFVLTNWMVVCLFSFPLFLLFPLGMDCMGPYEGHWCSFVGTKAGNDWFLTVLSLDFALIALTTCTFLYFAFKIAFSRYGSFGVLFKGAALYSLITIVSWLPKVFTVNSLFPSAFSPREYMFISRIVTYLTGIAYGLLFLKEKKSLRLLSCCGCCDCCIGSDMRFSDLGQPAASGDFDHTEDGCSFYAESHNPLVYERFAFSTDTDASFDVTDFVSNSTAKDDKQISKPLKISLS